jgi:hypothetical protein
LVNIYLTQANNDTMTPTAILGIVAETATCAKYIMTPRSMVLKVVTGKILETLELAWYPVYPAAFVLARVGQVPAFKDVSDKTRDEA